MNVVCFVFTLCITGIFPAVMLIGLLAGRRRYLKSYFAGLATFLVFQILLRVPILNRMSSMGWQSILFLKSPWLYALFLGFTAALFEEGGRFLTMKLFIKKERGAWEDVVFGVGHWAMEALYIIGINAVYTLFMNPGLIAVMGSNFFIGGLERLFVLPVHVAFSVMVMQAVRERKYFWLVLAVFLHAAVDAYCVLAQTVWGMGIVEIEGSIAAIGILLFIYIIITKRGRKKNVPLKEEAH